MTPPSITETATSGATVNLSRITREAAPLKAAAIVSDEGLGVPPARQEEMFERFHREQHPPGGHGLGLAIVRDVALAHGGSVAFLTRAGLPRAARSLFWKAGDLSRCRRPRGYNGASIRQDHNLHTVAFMTQDVLAEALLGRKGPPVAEI